MSTQKKVVSSNTGQAHASPEQLAVTIAVLLDRDPKTAAQIKQHIPPTRLRELLKL